MRLELSPDAEADYLAIIADSASQHGEAAARRYRLLIQRAFEDVLTRPERRALAGLPADVRLYPIALSRLKLPPGDRVATPRHVIAYRYDAECVQIVRILHERMDLPGRLGRR